MCLLERSSGLLCGEEIGGRSGWGKGRIQVAVSGIQQMDGGGLDEVNGGDTGEESMELREIWEEEVARL